MKQFQQANCQVEFQTMFELAQLLSALLLLDIRT